MYVKASSRKTKDGQVIRYLRLAHNEWDARAGVSRTKILHSFGREDELDKDAVKRLVAALSRLLDPADALAANGKLPDGIPETARSQLAATLRRDADGLIAITAAD